MVKVFLIFVISGKKLDNYDLYRALFTYIQNVTVPQIVIWSGGFSLCLWNYGTKHDKNWKQIIEFVSINKYNVLTCLLLF